MIQGERRCLRELLWHRKIQKRFVRTPALLLSHNIRNLTVCYLKIKAFNTKSQKIKTEKDRNKFEKKFEDYLDLICYNLIVVWFFDLE